LVALVDRERRFLRLVDRRAVLESLALERDPIMKGTETRVRRHRKEDDPYAPALLADEI
jgi:hypothetical protein